MSVRKHQRPARGGAPAMTHSRRSSPTARRGTPAPLPTTIWLPAPDDLADTPAGQVLPDWAIDKLRVEFTLNPGQRPAPLLRLEINDTRAGMDARTRCTTHRDTDVAPSGQARSSVILAELHPDTLPCAPLHSSYGPEERGAMDDGWPGLFHRAHRLLHAEGLLLLATRQRRDAGHLTDPLGLLIATARTAGFRYLQHIAVVHGHAIEDRIAPAPPDATTPELIHSDLIVLSAVRAQ
ncbi:hypothetical protein ACFQ7F_07675 [Streptomyces sp. NPDC056486]|uniref:hypothetical protein n=1 Tax=Streptomyces sp. NPDC056486 TaxID=3345835 RepID=UPI0036B0BDB0